MCNGTHKSKHYGLAVRQQTLRWYHISARIDCGSASTRTTLMALWITPEVFNVSQRRTTSIYRHRRQHIYKYVINGVTSITMSDTHNCGQWTNESEHLINGIEAYRLLNLGLRLNTRLNLHHDKSIYGLLDTYTWWLRTCSPILFGSGFCD